MRRLAAEILQPTIDSSVYFHSRIGSMDRLQFLKPYSPICMGPQAFDLQADNIDLIPNHHLFGGVSEWPKEPVLKTGVVQTTVGSNPTLSAIQSPANCQSL